MEDAFTLRSAACSPHRITAGQIDHSETELDAGYRCQNLTVMLFVLIRSRIPGQSAGGTLDARIICLFS